MIGRGVKLNEDKAISTPGLNLIMHFEDCRKRVGDDLYKAYRCPVGTLTIGWGHTGAYGKHFLETDVWSRSDCDRNLLYDMGGYGVAVRRWVRVRLEQYQFDALVSFAYNVKLENFTRSTLLDKLNNRDYDGAAEEFVKWNRTRGQPTKVLTQRRKSEELLFRGKPDENYRNDPTGTIIHLKEIMPQAVDPVLRVGDGLAIEEAAE